jgi:predicted nucleic acid-binding protein
MNKSYIDANVILRYLTKDPPGMAEKALKVFTDAKKGQVTLLITFLTVAEVVWVLESYYGHPKKQISETLIQFLLCDGLEVESLDLLIGALNLYQEKNIDFSDAVLASQALRKGPASIYSFDHHFNRIPGITIVKPA